MKASVDLPLGEWPIKVPLSEEVNLAEKHRFLYGEETNRGVSAFSFLVAGIHHWVAGKHAVSKATSTLRFLVDLTKGHKLGSKLTSPFLFHNHNKFYPLRILHQLCAQAGMWWKLSEGDHCCGGNYRKETLPWGCSVFTWAGALPMQDALNIGPGSLP